MENIITIQHPKSPISEAYKILRTNVQFSSFDKRIQSIVVTSSTPGEGKSTTAVNLAVVMAQNGHKTILIDCDQRKPVIHKMFLVSNQKGLSDFLIENGKFEDFIISTEVPNLDIMTAGTKPPNPAELLASEKIKGFIENLKECYDYIIVDTPPVTVVTDAQVISSYTDGCLLVVASSETEKPLVLKAKESLDNVNAKIIGVIFNKIKYQKSRYYYEYYDSEDLKRNKRNNKRSNKKSNKGYGIA